MILIVTFSQARTKRLKSKESENIHNRSYVVHKRQLYYNQKKGKEVKQMKTIKDYNGNNIDFEAAVMLMDDEIREQLHGMGIEDEQEFYNAYCEKHYEKYNEEFEI